MKLTEEQIERIITEQTKLEKEIGAFEIGVDYILRKFNLHTKSKDKHEKDWIKKLIDKIYNFAPDDMKIGDTNFSNCDESNFYVFLGEYLEKILFALEKCDDEGVKKYFKTKILEYKRHILNILKEE